MATDAVLKGEFGSSAEMFIETFAKLAAPFDHDEVRSRSQGGRDFQYVTARTVMNRLDEVLGPAGWWDEYTPMENAVICKLTIRLPCGTTLTKSDAGGFTTTADTSDYEKSGFSDAFKRAAVKFGVARYLYGDGIPPSLRQEIIRARREDRAAAREPGSDDDSAPGPDVDGRATQPRHEPARRGGGSAPKSGKALFAWAKEQSEMNGVELLKLLTDFGKARGFPARMVQWDGDQVSAGYSEGTAFLAHNGHVA